MELAEGGISAVYYFVLYVSYFPTGADFQEVCFNLSSQQLLTY